MRGGGPRLGAEPDRATWKKTYKLYMQAFQEPATEAEKKRLGKILKKPLPQDVVDMFFAYEAFLRSRGGSFNDESATRFLVLDRLFPRTIIYSLRRAEKVLSDLDPGGGRLGVSSEARRIIGKTLMELEYDSAEDIVRDLPRQLNGVQSAISRASQAVSEKYFIHAQEASWFGGVL